MQWDNGLMIWLDLCRPATYTTCTELEWYMSMCRKIHVWLQAAFDFKVKHQYSWNTHDNYIDATCVTTSYGRSYHSLQSSVSPSWNSNVSDASFGEGGCEDGSCGSLVIDVTSIPSASHNALAIMERSLICIPKLSKSDMKLVSYFECEMCLMNMSKTNTYHVLIGRLDVFFGSISQAVGLNIGIWSIHVILIKGFCIRWQAVQWFGEHDIRIEGDLAGCPLVLHLGSCAVIVFDSMFDRCIWSGGSAIAFGCMRLHDELCVIHA